GPGQRAVVAARPDAFGARYSTAISVYGPWSGSLPDHGVELSVRAADGHVLVELQLADGPLWPFAAGGFGSSLELVSPTRTPTAEWSRPSRWRGSAALLGAPGTPDRPASGVVINEVFPGRHAASGRTDQVELLNTADVPVDLGGWQLSNSSTGETHYTFPP